MYDLIVEAVVVGVMTIIFGNIAGFLIGPLFKVDLPKVCSTWNEFYTMEITLFVTGVLIHFFCEYTGINKWYCKKNLCRRW